MKTIARYTTKNKYTKTTPMTEADVRLYFKKISYESVPVEINRNIIMKRMLREPGSFCERCGILIGERQVNKRGYPYKSFYVCESCLKDKESGRKEATPDIEDIERFI